jgi:hypothetical protein
MGILICILIWEYGYRAGPDYRPRKGEKTTMNKITKNICFLVVVFAIAGASIKLSLADGGPTAPLGPNYIQEINSTRMSNASYGPKPWIAEAGNITELLINATSPSRSWAGYFGNITGQIVLQDVNNNTLYDWQNLEPQGEIYASTNNSVNWPTIRCFNHTSDEGSGDSTDRFVQTDINATTENARYGIENTAPDAINATFNRTTHVQFNIGTITIPTNTCYVTWTYVNNVSQSTDFQEMLLTDGNPYNALLFMTFIENNDINNETDTFGFDGRDHDFQMLVAEDGHPGASEDLTTTYYFWTEIQ